MNLFRFIILPILFKFTKCNKISIAKCIEASNIAAGDKCSTHSAVVECQKQLAACKGDLRAAVIELSGERPFVYSTGLPITAYDDLIQRVTHHFQLDDSSEFVFSYNLKGTDLEKVYPPNEFQFDVNDDESLAGAFALVRVPRLTLKNTSKAPTPNPTPTPKPTKEKRQKPTSICPTLFPTLFPTTSEPTTTSKPTKKRKREGKTKKPSPQPTNIPTYGDTSIIKKKFVARDLEGNEVFIVEIPRQDDVPNPMKHKYISDFCKLRGMAALCHNTCQSHQGDFNAPADYCQSVKTLDECGKPALRSLMDKECELSGMKIPSAFKCPIWSENPVYDAIGELPTNNRNDKKLSCGSYDGQWCYIKNVWVTGLAYAICVNPSVIFFFFRNVLFRMIIQTFSKIVFCFSVVQG